MSNRKQRGDAKLKTLKPELQAEIFARCSEGRYEEVRKWLKAEWSIVTSVGSLSDFYSWYQLRQRFMEAESHVNQLSDMVKQSGLKVDAVALKDTMNSLFLSLASKSGDFETFEAAFKLILKQQDQELTMRRVALLEAKAKQAEDAAKIAGNADLTATEKEARMKQVFGIS